MKNQFWQDFQYYYLCPKDPRLEYRSVIEKSYLFWKEIWFNSLNEIENVEKMYADNFSRCDYFSVLFYQDEPILMCLFTKHDISTILTTDDSYFQIWPKEVFKSMIQKNISDVMVCSHYTLGTKYRQIDQYKVKDLVLGLTHCAYQDSGLPYMLGTTRNLKKTNQLMYSMGCIPLAQNIIYHGEPSDLVILKLEASKENLYVTTPEYLREFLLYLWNHRNQVKQNLKIAA